MIEDHEEPECDEPIPIEFGDAGDEDLEWSELARARMRRITLEKVELPISQLVAMIESSQIDLAPEFQRRARWTRKQRSRLIESVLMWVPIPPVFLGEEKLDEYVVLDGRQRLSALFAYLSNDFALSGLTVWPELNGKRFSSLRKMGDPRMDRAITRRFLPAVIIREESGSAVKYEVFDRLNTGGVIAEAMEVRNAVYRGAFNRQLHHLSNNHVFRRLWGIPVDDSARLRNTVYKKMADVEMVLRFFAMQEFYRFRGRLKGFLNTIMEEKSELYEADASAAAEDERLFESTVETTYRLLGEKAFHRLLDNDERSDQPSAPLADALLYSVSQFEPNAPLPSGNDIQETLDRLYRDDSRFNKAMTTGTNDRFGTYYRMRAAKAAIVNDEQPWNWDEGRRDELARPEEDIG